MYKKNLKNIKKSTKLMLDPKDWDHKNELSKFLIQFTLKVGKSIIFVYASWLAASNEFGVNAQKNPPKPNFQFDKDIEIYETDSQGVTKYLTPQIQKVKNFSHELKKIKNYDKLIVIEKAINNVKIFEKISKNLILVTKIWLSVISNNLKNNIKKVTHEVLQVFALLEILKQFYKELTFKEKLITTTFFPLALYCYFYELFKIIKIFLKNKKENTQFSWYVNCKKFIFATTILFTTVFFLHCVLDVIESTSICSFFENFLGCCIYKSLQYTCYFLRFFKFFYYYGGDDSRFPNCP